MAYTLKDDDDDDDELWILRHFGGRYLDRWQVHRKASLEDSTTQ
jgi:hypothetical protein